MAIQRDLCSVDPKDVKKQVASPGEGKKNPDDKQHTDDLNNMEI